MEAQKQQNGNKPNQAVFIRLCVSLVVLGIAILLRTFYPDQTRDFLRRAVAGGMDYTAILGDVGESLRSFLVGVPQPDEPDGMQQAAGEDGKADPFDIRPDETYDPLKEPPPDGDEPTFTLSAPGDPLSAGGFDIQIPWADARYFLSEFDGEDDTFPLPFGMQKPDRVDYTVHELPFETVLPVSGTLSSSFGYRIHPIYGDWRFHYGMDIANSSGTPIAAFADGTVAAVGSSNGYGNYLLIEHDGGYISLYAHCKKVTVKTGDAVKAGQEIATVGSTGLSTGPHLHFELRVETAFLDPADYLEV